MSTILESVNTLSEKLGVTEREQTIKDQLDLCVERLGGEGNSKDIAESAEKFAEKEDGTATFMTKTITENNTYNAADDGVSGYSSVTVEVENQIHSVYCSIADDSFALFWSNNGEYDISNSGLEMLGYCVLCDPAVAIAVNTAISSCYEFTPGESFVVTVNGTPVALSGDTVTPNDGMAYTLRIGGGPTGEPVYTITKNDDIFEVTIS